jgi:Flp pilus assembly pilin Flp
MQFMRDLIRDDQGQDLIEYALLMAVLACAVVGVVSGVQWGVFSGKRLRMR